MAIRISDLSDDFIRRVVDEYLCYLATMATVAEKFKTTPTTISNILFKAVSENIVDDITAQTVVHKATTFTENVVRTRNRWQKALNIRKLPAIREEIAYKTKKLQELEVQFESFDDYFIDEPDAPSKRSIWCSIGRLRGEITRLENYIKGIMI